MKLSTLTNFVLVLSTCFTALHASAVEFDGREGGNGDSHHGSPPKAENHPIVDYGLICWALKFESTMNTLFDQRADYQRGTSAPSSRKETRGNLEFRAMLSPLTHIHGFVRMEVEDKEFGIISRSETMFKATIPNASTEMENTFMVQVENKKTGVVVRFVCKAQGILVPESENRN